MNKKSPSSKTSTESILLEDLMVSAWYLVTSPFILISYWFKSNPGALSKFDSRNRNLLFGALLLTSVGVGIYLKLKSGRPDLLTIGIGYFGAVIFFLSLASLIVPIFFQKNRDRITTSNLKNKKRDFTSLLPILFETKTIPLGVSMKTGNPYFIPVAQSLEHIVVSGATGVGKTSALMTMFQHSLLHRFPVIIIDPKGDLIDLTVIREMAKMYGREDELMVFSLSDPENSCSYNVTKVGTPENKKSKLVDGLSLTHEYYGAIADLALGNIFEILEYLKEENVDMDRVLMLLSSEETRLSMEEHLVHLPENEDSNRILKRFESLKKIPQKDLTGLCAQLQSFSMSEFGGIMQRAGKRTEIDMMDVLMNGKIAYFQLNTNAYSSLARKFGKLIIQDLRFTSSKIQSSKDGKRANFASVFIDEFGSFAMKDFADFQKMVRTAGISLRLFFQGTADLTIVSKEFGDQVLGNCLTKIIFRQDLDEDVSKWAGMAGTVDAMIESFQTVDHVMTRQRTGAGNIHEGKKMKIEFDVFKELGKGQAVVIDKGRKINDIIEIWDSKNPIFLPTLKKYLLEKKQTMDQNKKYRSIAQNNLSSSENHFGSSHIFKKSKSNILKSN